MAWELRNENDVGSGGYAVSSVMLGKLLAKHVAVNICGEKTIRETI